MSKRTDQKAIEQLEAIYARLPDVQCKGLCGHEVCGPILMTRLEADRMRRAVHEQPRTTSNMTCGYLSDRGRCRVYHIRPLICRVFGLVKRMSCMHGCVPDRWLTDEEFVALAKEVERIGGALAISTPDGPLETGQSFLDLRIDPDDMPPELTDRLAELTRGLRALYHGRIVGVTPKGGGERRWINIDKERHR
jgi:Fe-S-cluster containining protein